MLNIYEQIILILYDEELTLKSAERSLKKQGYEDERIFING
ncbi:MAG: hypothetical protein ACI9AU_000060 [Bacteroidia bacterium]|jgi:hypothetical protein